MRSILSVLLFVFAFAAVNTSVAESATTTPSPDEKAAPAAAPKWDQTRDAFLAFAFEKTKAYAGAAEVAVGKGVDLAMKEGPATAHEFLVWRAWKHGINGITPLVLMGCFILLFVKQYQKWSFDRYFRVNTGTDLNVIYTIVGVLGTGITFCILCNQGFNNIMSFIQVLVSPRIYIIEQVMHLFGH